MQTHSYTEVKFKCQDRVFVGKCIETMDVHMGLNQTNTLECGLFNVNLESLNT